MPVPRTECPGTLGRLSSRTRGTGDPTDEDRRCSRHSRAPAKSLGGVSRSRAPPAGDSRLREARSSRQRRVPGGHEGRRGRDQGNVRGQGPPRRPEGARFVSPGGRGQRRPGLRARRHADHVVRHRRRRHARRLQRRRPGRWAHRRRRAAHARRRVEDDGRPVLRTHEPAPARPGMKAAFFKEHGGSEKILYDDYRDPAPGATDVVVRVAACALNHVDMLLLDGRFPPPEGLPHVNGCEVTGVVEATGAEVKGRTPGQRVIIFPGFSCGQCEYCLRGERTVCTRYGYLGAHKDGGYAELVKAPAANLLPLPEAISFEAGAAVPLAMLTSWHALGAKADVRPGQTVLVQAAGSGVGSAALQIAPLCRARVLTTVRSDDHLDFPRRLGPVIDRAFALKDTRAAVQHVLDRKNKGKVLIVP